MKHFRFILIINLLLFAFNSYAAEREINLTVSNKTVYLGGKPKKAIVVNNQLPAPTLSFNQGDIVTIHVQNCLDEETALHWHGLLIPWQMDGVLGVSQKGIQPGKKFTYKFRLRQAGTYWYHAHAGLQEQDGLYGGFIVHPNEHESYRYNRDFVIVLSDWSNTPANQIFANLKKDGDYYSPRFPLQPSLTKFIHDYSRADAEEKSKLVADYKSMQHMRMSLYDINDVAYDAFLLNGRNKSCPWTKLVNVGDVVRLRFIGAIASTIMKIKIANAAMEMVHVQGNDVHPYPVNDFTISPGETYDVLVRVNKDEPYIIYAESADKVSSVYGALITSPNQFVNYNAIQPFPEPEPVTRAMMKNMHAVMQAGMSQDHHHSHHTMATPTKMQHSMPASSKMQHSMSTPKKMQHSMPTEAKMQHSMPASAKMQHITPTEAKMQHSMPTEATQTSDQIQPANHAEEAITVGSKYQHLMAAVPTNDTKKPIAGVINLELFGYMDRFIWFINGVPEYKAKPIILDPAKRYRFVFTNHSMMNHPMHLHGHWFILRNGHGRYDPLLHTIEVAPGSKITADVDTDASGQWFFHCHMLYHMFAGMARVFQYSTVLQLTKGEIKPENEVRQTAFYNRPIVRVDEERALDASLVHHPMPHPAMFFAASQFDLGYDPNKDVATFSYKGLYGPDYHKLELLIEDAELNKGVVENADLDIFYWHLISQFWAVKGGVNYFYRPANSPYFQPGVGIEGLMPYFIDTDIRAYFYAGSAKLDIDLARDTQIINNFLIRLGVRAILASKTVNHAQLGSGLNQSRFTVTPFYRLMPGLNLFLEYEYEKYYGSFKRIQTQHGEAATQTTLSLGFSLLV